MIWVDQEYGEAAVTHSQKSHTAALAVTPELRISVSDGGTFTGTRKEVRRVVLPSGFDLGGRR